MHWDNNLVLKVWLGLGEPRQLLLWRAEEGPSTHRVPVSTRRTVNVSCGTSVAQRALPAPSHSHAYDLCEDRAVKYWYEEF